MLLRSKLMRLLALLPLAWLWWHLVEHLHVEWMVNPDYSYGWMVPVLCGCLAWRKLNDGNVPTKERQNVERSSPRGWCNGREARGGLAVGCPGWLGAGVVANTTDRGSEPGMAAGELGPCSRDGGDMPDSPGASLLCRGMGFGGREFGPGAVSVAVSHLFLFGRCAVAHVCGRPPDPEPDGGQQRRGCRVAESDRSAGPCAAAM